MRRLGILAALTLVPLTACSGSTGADPTASDGATQPPSCTGKDTVSLRARSGGPALDARATGGWTPTTDDSGIRGVACGSLFFDQAPAGWKFVSLAVTLSDGTETSSVSKRGLGGHDNVAQLWTDGCVTLTAKIRLARTGGTQKGTVAVWTGTTQIEATCAG